MLKISCLLTKQDGSLDCKHLDKATCPPLDCTVDQQISIEDACCPFCRGTDLCALFGHSCHVNATCRNTDDSYECECNKGFSGNGKQCSDYDECAGTDAGEGHKCMEKSRCINLVGTYRCDCLPGYVMTDDGYTCQGKAILITSSRRVYSLFSSLFSPTDVDECASDQHDCDANALCVNNEGSYDCQCVTGFYGDGYSCEMINDPSSSLLAGGSQPTSEPVMSLNVYSSGTATQHITVASSLSSLLLLLSSYIFYAL